MAAAGTGTGLTRHSRGYLQVTRRGPLRNKLAHRLYAERQLGRPLAPHEIVHHNCRNRMCWPPTDFHLVIMDMALHVDEARLLRWEKRRR